MKFQNRGVNLRSAVDELNPGEHRILKNVRSTIEGSFTPRSGTTRLTPGTPLADLLVHTVRFLNDPVAGTSLLYALAGTHLYNVASGAPIATPGAALSGNPVTTADYRLSGNSSPVAILADFNAMNKLTSAGVTSQLGITPPAAAAVTAAVAAATFTIEEFETDTARFVYSQIAAHSIVAGKITNALSVTTNVNVQASVSEVVTADFTTVGGLPTSDSDYFHIWINIDNPTNISEIRILFDVATDSVAGGVFTGSAFTKNYYFTSIRGSDLQNAAAASVTAITARQQSLAFANVEGALFPRSLFGGYSQSATLGSTQTSSGLNQWTSFSIQRAKFIQVGDQTRTWAQVVGFRILIITASGVATTCILDNLFFFGGGGPDSTLGVNYDYRFTYEDLATLSESNPSPIQALANDLVLQRQAATLSFVASPDPQVNAGRWWRRGGTLADAWRLLGQQANAALSVIGSSWAGLVGTLTTNTAHQMLVGQGITVTGVNPAGYNATFLLTGVTSNTLSFALIVNPGVFVSGVGSSVKFADVFSDTAIASATVLALTNDVPVTTVSSAGATVFAQPLAFVWGPYNGTTLFAVGDPNRPGFAYSCNPTNPDGWSSLQNYEVTQPSDPLQNGFIWDRRPFVFSKEHLYEFLSIPIGSTSTFVTLDLQIGAGLAARWGLAASPQLPKVWFVGKDAVYEWAGGPAVSITEDSLWPLFQGRTVEGIAPIDWTKETKIRLEYMDRHVRFKFVDTGGNVQVWLYHIEKRRWTGPDLYPWGPETVYQKPEVAPGVMLFGGTNGHVYQESTAALDDAGASIPCQVRTGSNDFDDPQEIEEFGTVVVDLDAQGLGGAPTPVTIKALFNDEAITTGLGTQAPVGRQQLPISLGDFYARSIGFDFSWKSTAAPVLYGYEIFWRPDVVNLNHYESPPESFGVPGFGHVFDGYIELRSTGSVNLIVAVDGVALPTVVIPSTAGARLKNYVQFAPNKGKVWQIQKLDSLDGSNIRLYQEGSYLNICPWGGTAVPVRPFAP